jgi:hypothetical protein
VTPDLPSTVAALGLRSGARWEDCLREMRRLVDYEQRVRSAARELGDVATRVGALVEAATDADSGMGV